MPNSGIFRGKKHGDYCDFGQDFDIKQEISYSFIMRKFFLYIKMTTVTLVLYKSSP